MSNFSNKKPYLFSRKLSPSDHFRYYTRTLKESTFKESQFEKPYLKEAGQYQQMHLDYPGPILNPFYDDIPTLDPTWEPYDWPEFSPWKMPPTYYLPISSLPMPYLPWIGYGDYYYHSNRTPMIIPLVTPECNGTVVAILAGSNVSDYTWRRPIGLFDDWSVNRYNEITIEVSEKASQVLLLKASNGQFILEEEIELTCGAWHDVTTDAYWEPYTYGGNSYATWTGSYWEPDYFNEVVHVKTTGDWADGINPTSLKVTYTDAYGNMRLVFRDLLSNILVDNNPYTSNNSVLVTLQGSDIHRLLLWDYTRADAATHKVTKIQLYY